MSVGGHPVAQRSHILSSKSVQQLLTQNVGRWKDRKWPSHIWPFSAQKVISMKTANRRKVGIWPPPAIHRTSKSNLYQTMTSAEHNICIMIHSLSQTSKNCLPVSVRALKMNLKKLEYWRLLRGWWRWGKTGRTEITTTNITNSEERRIGWGEEKRNEERDKEELQ
jgi:hypothetical protein